MNLSMQFNHEKYSDEELKAAIQDVLEKNTTLALATVDNGDPYINTAHFGYSEKLEFFIITSPTTKHSQNAEKNPHVAIAIWNTPEKSGTNLQGLQLFGVYKRVNGKEIDYALRVYGAGSKDFLEKFPSAEVFEKAGLTFYKITVNKIKLLNEPRFGRRNFIDLLVTHELICP